MSSSSLSQGETISMAEQAIIKAEIVISAPTFPENLPTEAEIDSMYAEIDDYKEQLRRCRLCRERYLLRIQWLESDIDTLKRRKQDLMDGILERRDDFEDVSAQCAARLNELDSAIHHLLETITVLETDIENKTTVITIMQQDQDVIEKENSDLFGTNIATISELEGKIAALRDGNAHMRDYLEGKTDGNHNLRRSLEQSTNENTEKSRIIIEYLSRVEGLLGALIAEMPAAAQDQCLATDEAIVLEDPDVSDNEIGISGDTEADTEGCVSTHALIYAIDSLVEKTRLRQSRDLQLQVLEQLADSLAEGRMRTARHIEKESARLAELQSGAADFLNLQPEVDEYADNFAYLKRLLGIMVEKAKKQALQISTLLYILEKKDQMNDVMAEKVKEIALEQMKMGNLLRNARQSKGKAKKLSNRESKRLSSVSKTSKLSK